MKFAVHVRLAWQCILGGKRLATATANVRPRGEEKICATGSVAGRWPV